MGVTDRPQDVFLYQTQIESDGGISITVVEIRGDKVRIGIDAPKHIRVHRKEVWLAINKEKNDEQCVSAEVP